MPVSTRARAPLPASSVAGRIDADLLLPDRRRARLRNTRVRSTVFTALVVAFCALLLWVVSADTRAHSAPLCARKVIIRECTDSDEIAREASVARYRKRVDECIEVSLGPEFVYEIMSGGVEVWPADVLRVVALNNNRDDPCCKLV